MNKEFIQQLTGIVEANLANETFGPDELVREVGMSHSNLNRKLKNISNQNASQFIREIRLKKAKELLLNNDLTVAEISYQVGFGSPTYFNKCFREYFGVAPGELRKIDPEIQAEQPVEPRLKRTKYTKILIGLIISFMVLIPTAFFLIHNVAGSKASDVKEKSIALLPFKYLSDESEKQYLADGMMDAILVHLSKIKDLRVISRTSVEQYRKTDKTSKTIGQELDVKYVLEGSFVMTGNQARLILQLIKTNDDSHVWSDMIDRDSKDIFSMQSEVAETVANKLQAVITPEEQKLIRKAQTNNLTAYDYYLRGKDELEKLEFKVKSDSNTLNKAQQYFRSALEADSTYALAYTGLAAIQYWTSGKDYLSESYMDSAFFLANKALVYDQQCAEAYFYRAQFYSETSKTAEALNEIDKVLTIDPNYWKAYNLRSVILEKSNDLVGAISNLYELVLRNRGSGLPLFLKRFGYRLSDYGFPDLGKKFNQQALELHGDSTRFLYCLAWSELSQENFEKGYQLAKSASKKDSTFGFLIRGNDLSVYCMLTHRYEEAYFVNLKFLEWLNKSSEIDTQVSMKIGYYLWETGRTKEAEFYFNQVIKFHQDCLKLGRSIANSKWSQFELAEMYAILGNKEKVYYYLDDVNKKRAFPKYWVVFFKYSPFFNSIRHEPRFQKILKDVEAKYQAENERVRKWMVAQGIN